MNDLEQRLDEELRRLVAAVPTAGVLERIDMRRWRRARWLRLKVGGLAAGAAAVVVVAAWVGAGHRDDAAVTETGGRPRFVTTVLPEGFVLGSVTVRDLASDANHLRYQVFGDAEVGATATWQLIVQTLAAPPDDSPAASEGRVRGQPAAIAVQPDGTSVAWGEGGRFYRVYSLGLPADRTLELIDAMALRGGTKAGVELDAPSLLDHAPAYAPGATWADYSFISRGSEADLFSMHVWSGIAEASVAAEQQPGESTTTVQVRGKPGALIQGPGRLALAWFEHPGVRVLIDNGHGALSREELFEVADGLRRVDEAEWDAYVAGAVGHPPERAAAR